MSNHTSATQRPIWFLSCKKQTVANISNINFRVAQVIYNVTQNLQVNIFQYAGTLYVTEHVIKVVYAGPFISIYNV